MNKLRKIGRYLTGSLKHFCLKIGGLKIGGLKCFRLPLVLLLIFTLCLCARWWQLAHLLPDQQTAERWQGASDLSFAQISCYVPGRLENGQLNSFRAAALDALSAAGLTEVNSDVEPQPPQRKEEAAPVGSLAWSKGLMADALSWQTQLTASGSYASRETAALAVDGDWCSFHPLEFCSGAPFSSADLSHDRVLLSEALAFHLFGAVDAAGLTVELAGRPYLVAGVFRLPDRALLRDLYADPDLLIFWQDQQNVTASALPAACCCYEFVLAQPYRDFAQQLAQDSELFREAEIQANSGRFRPTSVMKELWHFPQRVVQIRPLAYPTWENAARLIQSHLLIILTLLIATLLCIIGLLTAAIIRVCRQGADHAADHTLLSGTKQQLSDAAPHQEAL